MKINHEKRRLLGTLRDPFPQLNPLREAVYSNGRLVEPVRNNGGGGSGRSVEEIVSGAPTDAEAKIIRELRRMQDELRRQRTETRGLVDHITAMAQEVRQLRSQLLSFTG